MVVSKKSLGVIVLLLKLRGQYNGQARQHSIRTTLYMPAGCYVQLRYH